MRPAVEAERGQPLADRSSDWLGVAWHDASTSVWRCMAGYTELVALGVSEVGAIVVLVIVRPEPWSAFAYAAVRESNLVGFIDEFARACQKSNHLPVARSVRRRVVWLADEKQRPRSGSGLPASPGPFSFDEARLDFEHFGKR